MAPTAIGASTAFSPCRSIPTLIVGRPYTPHSDESDYKLAGMQLFDMTHSLRDDATDCFYSPEKEKTDDAGLLEASGLSSSSPQWNLLNSRKTVSERI